jgi:pimeloyl-ACP methyl ester carboxylesterase
VATFALVHGAWHDAWCWELLTPLLRQAGHQAIAMDLPCEDGAASFDAYADVVCGALDGSDDDVVLVGHSLGGNTVPLVAARRPARHVVYLCSLIPDLGRSLGDQLRDETDMLNPLYVQGLSEPDGQRRRQWVDEDLARAVLFDDCGDAIARAAVQHLRPQALHPYGQPFTLEQFPPVPCTYVVCAQDQLVNPEWSRRTAGARLGAEIIELPGGHSPFLSRPVALAEVLLSVVE